MMQWILDNYEISAAVVLTVVSFVSMLAAFFWAISNSLQNQTKAQIAAFNQIREKSEAEIERDKSDEALKNRLIEQSFRMQEQLSEVKDSLHKVSADNTHWKSENERLYQELLDAKDTAEKDRNEFEKAQDSIRDALARERREHSRQMDLFAEAMQDYKATLKAKDDYISTLFEQIAALKKELENVQARLSEHEAKLIGLRQDRDAERVEKEMALREAQALRIERDELIQARAELEKRVASLEEQVAVMEKQIKEFEKDAA